MTEIEELSDDEAQALQAAQPDGPVHIDAVDADGNCTHRQVGPVNGDKYLRACACNHVRRLICQKCYAVINLGGSSIVWPYSCETCRKPACLRCANEMARTATGIACHSCPSTASSAVSWSVLLRISFWDRDKRRHNTLRPQPVLHATRDAAAQGALDYLPVFVNSVLVDDVRAALVERMRQQFMGWFNAPDQRSGYEVIKVEVGLFPMHPAGTKPLPAPVFERSMN